VCNTLRVVPTVLFYGYASPEVADMFHDLSGWGVNLLAFLILLGLIQLARWLGVPVDRPAAGGDAGPGASQGNGRAIGEVEHGAGPRADEPTTTPTGTIAEGADRGAQARAGARREASV
jgi:hypothetical protein